MKLTKELLLLLLFFATDAKRDRDGEDMRVDLTGTGYSLDDAIELGKKWGSEKISFRILVMGKTGFGKSELVNGLIGKALAEAKDDFSSVTKITKAYNITIGNVDLVVFDSPGLFDRKMKNEDIFSDIKTKTGQDIDLLLYCTKMTETRIGEDQIKAIQRVTKALGKSVWEKALFVSTFANHITKDTIPISARKMALDEYFEKRLIQMKKYLHEIMIEDIGVSPAVTKHIPVVPAGDDKPKLPGFDREHWISELWIQAFRKLDFKRMLAFLLLSEGRLSITNSTHEIHTGSPEKQPLLVKHMSEDDHFIDPGWYPLIGHVVGAAVGTASGYILIPGVGAAYGMTIGSVSGEAIGNFLEYLTTRTELPPDDTLTAVDKVILRSLVRAFQDEKKLS